MFDEGAVCLDQWLHPPRPHININAHTEGTPQGENENQVGIHRIGLDLPALWATSDDES
jgi:hypothetical protein